MTGTKSTDQALGARLRAALKNTGQDQPLRVSTHPISRPWKKPVLVRARSARFDDDEDLFDNVPV